MPGIVYVLAGLLVLAGIACLFAIRLKRRRTAEFAAAAAEMNFAFVAETPAGFAAAFLAEGFALWAAGRRPAARNVLTAETGGIGVTVFDFAVTVGQGKSSHRHTQTVARFTVAGWSLPQFLARPRNWTDRWFARFKAAEITFDDPAFAERFRVVGDDPPRVRGVLKPAVRDALLTPFPGVTVEAKGDTILFYRPDVRVDPAEIKDFLADGYAVVAALRGDAV